MLELVGVGCSARSVLVWSAEEDHVSTRDITRRNMMALLPAVIGGFWLASRQSANGAQAQAGSNPSSSAEKSAGAPDPALLQDLVVANRILADKGFLDTNGHVSVRHNRNPNHYLMSWRKAPELVTV